MLSFLNKHAEELLGSIMLAAMAVISFLNVFVRYCTNFSFAWSEELTVNLFVFAVMLGTSAMFRESGHLGMSILYNALPRQLRLLCLFLSVAMGVGFFIALGYYGALEVYDEMDIEAVSESLGVPVWWYTISVPILSLLTIFRILQRAYLDLKSRHF